MFTSPSIRYAPVTAISTPVNNDEEEPRAGETVRPTVLELVLWILLSLSILCMWQVNALIAEVKRTPWKAVHVERPSQPGSAPPGSLGPPFDFEPKAKANESVVSFTDLFNSGAPTFAYLSPTVVSVLQRSQPSRILYNTSQHNVEQISLDIDHDVLIQFGDLDSQKNLCAVTLVPASNSQTVTVHASQHEASVWNVSEATAPLDPSTISYRHHPPRREYLGHLKFGLEQVSATAAFNCPNGAVTVLLQCMEMEDCWIEFKQSIRGNPYGLQLVQWNM